MTKINSGTQFDFTYAPGTSMEQIIGFEMAGEIWSSYLKDDVTIRIHVESVSELPNDVIGAALPGKKNEIDYETLWQHMSRDVISNNDRIAFSNLPDRQDDDFKEFSIVANGLEFEETKEFKITNANAKALNLLDGDRDKLDGYIVVNNLTENSAVGWDYDALRNSGMPNNNNNLDFLSVAMHEIGHILGFVSGVDDNAWLQVLREAQDEGKEINSNDFKFASTLDLYRYSSSSAATGQVDLSTGGNPFFSIDGGTSNLGWFANGNYTVINGSERFVGDGYQGSHWKQNSYQGIMDPTLPREQRRNIRHLDLTVMDVIGWDINTSNSLDRDRLYSNAVANSETAMIQDFREEVEEMIQESQYNGRLSSSFFTDPGDYSFQFGLWQLTTMETIDSSDTITVDNESSNETASQLESNLDNDFMVDELATESETNVDVDLFPASKNEEEELEENNNIFGAEGVSTEERDGDSLFSETTSEQIAEENYLYDQSSLLPEILSHLNLIKSLN